MGSSGRVAAHLVAGEVGRDHDIGAVDEPEAEAIGGLVTDTTIRHRPATPAPPPALLVGAHRFL